MTAYIVLGEGERGAAVVLGMVEAKSRREATRIAAERHGPEAVDLRLYHQAAPADQLEACRLERERRIAR